MAKVESRYSALIERVFLDRYVEGLTEIDFSRADIVQVAENMNIELPKNLGDLLYSFRFRSELPEKIIETQPEGREWLIELAGRSKYKFRLAKVNRIVPRRDMATINVPDATPELISAYAIGDEQSLLAKVRYNRLIDVFLGLTTYSLQNHLRTTVDGIGQIEIDELYVGIDRHGCHYIIPVQAKSGKDKISSVQASQDVLFAEDRFPGIRCRAVAAQFIDDRTVALFDLLSQGEEIRVVDERHYRLVPSKEIDQEAIRDYRD